MGNLMGTLAKVAIGVAVAKGAKAMLSGGSKRGQGNANGLFGGQYSNNQQSSSNPMDMISGLLSGGQQGAGGQGGLGGILESLTGGSSGTSQAGGLNGLLGGLAGKIQGGGSSNAGGLGGLLGGLAAMAGGQQTQQTNNQGFGAMFNQAIANKGQLQEEPTADQEAVAGLMLIAMIQAAKSDGNVDKNEIAKFTKDLGDIDQQEMDFIQKAMEAPVDVQNLVRQTPNGLEAQVYTMSVLAIDLDNQQEAQYLHQLATAYGLSNAQVNNIHDQLGAPRIYQ